MNVPTNILNELKCSNCEDLLSCGPVKQTRDGSNICGRCSNLKLEEPAVPNQPYNSLAALCAFPCKYEAGGCPQRVLFKFMARHEADCEFRTYICPVLESGRCEWIGPRNTLLQHVQEAHPEHVLPHPAKLEPDIRAASLRTFFMAAYNVLFLVHVKVCLATHTIYHSVRKLGGTYEYEGHTFKFFVNIENDNGNIIRKHEVAPQGSMVLQEDSAICIKINGIMEALGGFNNAKFTITIEEYMKCLICKENKNFSDIEIYDICGTSKMFYCTNCFSTLNTCSNASEGCSWRGYKTVHQKYVCSYTKNCGLCDDDLSEFNSVLDHWRQKHNSDHLQTQFCTMSKDKNKTITFSYKNQPYVLLYERVSEGNQFIVQSYRDKIKMQCILLIRNTISKRCSHYLMKKYFNSNVGQIFFMFVLNDDEFEPFVHNNSFDIDVDIQCYE